MLGVRTSWSRGGQRSWAERPGPTAPACTSSWPAAERRGSPVTIRPRENRVLTVLKTAAGLAALMFILLALLAAVAGAVGLVRRALRGPATRPTGLPQPPPDGERDR